MWLATDEVLQRPVAIKLTGPDPGGQTPCLRNFAAQARVAAALWHPNLVQIYDFGVTEARAFLVMEYLPLGSLEDRLQAGKIAGGDLRRLACELLSALSYLHRQGLVHGQLSAGRILLDAEGRAHLSGFPAAGAGVAPVEDDLFALGRLLARVSRAHDREPALSDLIGRLLAPASGFGLRTAAEALESLRVCPDPDGQATQEFDVLAALADEPAVKITRRAGGRDRAGRDLGGRDLGGRDLGERDLGGRDLGERDLGERGRRARARSGSRWTRQRVLMAIGRYQAP